jgi:hypothetical protein
LHGKNQHFQISVFTHHIHILLLLKMECSLLLGNFPDASYLPPNNVSYFSSLFPDQTSSQHPALDSPNPSLLDSSFSEVGQSFANVQSSSAAPAALSSTPISSFPSIVSEVTESQMDSGSEQEDTTFVHSELPAAGLEVAPSSLASKPGSMQSHHVDVSDEQETDVVSTYPFLLEERQTGGSLPILSSNTLGLPSSSLSFASSPCEWVPETSGPLQSLVDVAPLVLVRDFFGRHCSRSTLLQYLCSFKLALLLLSSNLIAYSTCMFPLLGPPPLSLWSNYLPKMYMLLLKLVVFVFFELFLCSHGVPYSP